MGLVRPLQPWDILLIYCNNQLKKCITPLLGLAKVHSLSPFWCLSEAFSVPFYTLIKLCYTKALEWSSLVPGPEATSSPDITNPTLFTVSYHSPGTCTAFHSQLQSSDLVTFTWGGPHSAITFHMARSLGVSTAEIRIEPMPHGTTGWARRPVSQP